MDGGAVSRSGVEGAAETEASGRVKIGDAAAWC